MKAIVPAVALLVSIAMISAAGQREDAKFDRVVLAPGKGPQLSLLYVVLTQPKANIDTLNELVVRYAKAALQVAAEHKFEGAITADDKAKHRGNVVFLVRSAKTERTGYITGFGVEQLREIVAASPEEGKRFVSYHTWGLGQLPDEKK
jgi:hypothetical protein